MLHGSWVSTEVRKYAGSRQRQRLHNMLYVRMVNKKEFNVSSFHWSQFVFLFYTLKPEGPQDKSGALRETVSCPIFPEPLNVILHGRADCRDEGL